MGTFCKAIEARCKLEIGLPLEIVKRSKQFIAKEISKNEIKKDIYYLKNFNFTNVYDMKMLVGLGRKTDSMRFSSEHRAAIITETMKFKADFGERQKVDC